MCGTINARFILEMQTGSEMLSRSDQKAVETAQLEAQVGADTEL